MAVAADRRCQLNSAELRAAAHRLIEFTLPIIRPHAPRWHRGHSAHSVFHVCCFHSSQASATSALSHADQRTAAHASIRAAWTSRTHSFARIPPCSSTICSCSCSCRAFIGARHCATCAVLSRPIVTAAVGRCAGSSHGGQSNTAADGNAMPVLFAFGRVHGLTLARPLLSTVLRSGIWRPVAAWPPSPRIPARQCSRCRV